MSYEMIIQNVDTGDIFDVSTLVNSIQYTTSLTGQAGKLSFILEKDPNDILNICVGSKVRFKTEDGGVFFGYIFTIGTDSTEAYKITAYDQTRYLKNKDVIYMENQSASQLFESICKKTNIKDYKIITPSTFVLQNHLFNNTTYWEMIDFACSCTLEQSKEAPYYFVRDNFGTLEFNELSKCKSNLIIGDESLLMDYKYELDIDKDSFNRIKIMKGNEEQGLTISTINQDVENINKWGLLQHTTFVDESMTDSQIQDFAKLFLLLKNRVRKTISINALGYHGMFAGAGFTFILNKLGIKQDMYIVSATHNYDADLHTMELEVSGFPTDVNSEIPKRKSNEEIAVEVIDGKWGVGEIRKLKLTAEGYDYETIQSLVNEVLLGR